MKKVQEQQTTKKEVQRGLQITGLTRVFTKDKEIEVKGKKVTITDCWTNVSQKIGDGQYLNKSINLIFPKEYQKPEHNSDIFIKEGWMMVTGKGEYQRLSIYVKEWDEDVA